MEMEAAGPCSKKRKSTGLEPLEAANPAAEGQGPGPVAEDQEPPLPGADAGGEDLISRLPDAILEEIISLLPTKEGARTQDYASRWRHLWRSAPLNLDHHQLSQNPKDLCAVMSRILAAHPGPCRRFCAPVVHLHGDRTATADAWFRYPALRNLQDLELCGWGLLRFPFAYPPPRPQPSFRFSETLCVVTIGDCQFPEITAQPIRFPKLKKLGLERVSISEYSLHTMLARCPALECLLIAHCISFRCVRINSITLRSICVKADYHEGLTFGELIIQNAPCLERLLQLIASQPHTTLISASKLETLGCLSSDHNNSTRLVLGSTVIQGLLVDSLTPQVRTVKILSVDMRALSLDGVIDLMKCFPCLERLYIECVGPGKPNIWRRNHRELLTTFDIRLKKISWRYYRGIKSHVDFATFFVLNAKVLELMTFQVHSEDYNEENFAEQREKLKLNKKASRGAQFHFTPDDSHRYVKDFRVHDLDLADPFERKDPCEFHDL